MQVRKALAGHSNKTTEEISKLMPDDFNKKLKEWEQIKEGKPQEVSGESHTAGAAAVEKKGKKKRKPQERWVRSAGKKGKEGQDDITTAFPEDISWLDKELIKIGREKQRLDRERLKCEEREVRLQVINTFNILLCFLVAQQLYIPLRLFSFFLFFSFFSFLSVHGLRYAGL